MCLALLVAAVAMVEGNPTGGFADDGRSVGPLCVTAGCVADVNRRFGTEYKWPEDMCDYVKAADVFVKYTSRATSDEERCRVWNKGYRGKNKKSAKVYARKVMAIYAEKLRGR